MIGRIEVYTPKPVDDPRARCPVNESIVCPQRVRLIGMYTSALVLDDSVFGFDKRKADGVLLHEQLLRHKILAIENCAGELVDSACQVEIKPNPVRKKRASSLARRIFRLG